MPEGEASRDFFESVVLFAVDMAFSKHAAAQGWASEPVLRGISKGSYRMELQVCLEDNLPSDCTGKAACQAVEGNTFTPMAYQTITLEDTLEQVCRKAFASRHGACCCIRCDLRGFRAPAATEVVVALSITGRPEPAITAKLLDADLAGVASRDVLRKILKTRFLEAKNPRITNLIPAGFGAGFVVWPVEPRQGGYGR